MTTTQTPESRRKCCDDRRQLLDSLSILDSDEQKDGKAAAQAFVTECHTHAEESCIKLRKQVSYAEELTRLLAEHAATE